MSPVHSSESSGIFSILDSFTGLNELFMDPSCHDVLSILKGIRNGFVYGARLRFSHAIVMAVLFKSGSWKKKLQDAFRASKTHGTSLATYVGVYKTVLYLLNLFRNHKVGPMNAQVSTKFDSLIAGCVGGYYVFGRPTAKAAGSGINQQVVLYIFSRVCIAVGKMIVLKLYYNTTNTQLARKARLGSSTAIAKPQILSSSSTKRVPTHTILGIPENQLVNASWAIFASLNWGLVMHLFSQDAKILQSSLARSMNYLYLDSNHWTSLRDFLTN
ncbi:hypothetical protein NADFUDRAFT_81458 [Nadsonia fulvescens var. elongata DSM 6958]|uniref:Peroxisomal membrane protein 4 n=1 Tax=Nadsonia fulvescens var. elongata DSM 6958 TaxID=857566 RepID=A0A1E3PSX0_9ASCO|nr:hypothetical protein NADFUDRAFT_81458 [Nadsonia fulvescens var. elongata DSM 6958]